jgi:hypothetical protein
MIRQLRRPAITCCALVAAGSLPAGCGGSGGASAARATPQTVAPVTTAQAAAYANAVNLTAGDVPGMTTEEPGGEAPAPTRSALALARCFDGVSPVRRVAKFHSPTFSSGRAAQAQLVESSVEVWPTPGLAARDTAAYFSSRGRACVLRFSDASSRRLNRQRAGGLQHGRPILATVPNPLPGVSESYLRTIAEPLLRGKRIRLYIYHDIFSFVTGPAEVELEATGFSRPVPSATEERLLSLLLSHAKANKL